MTIVIIYVTPRLICDFHKWLLESSSATEGIGQGPIYVRQQMYR
jgi:hypothetical protein